MKWIFLHIIVLWFLPAQDLDTLRLAYKEAGKDTAKISHFMDLVKDVSKESSPTLIGYKGAAIAIEAKTQKGIQNKVDAFKEGRGYIEYAIEKDPENTELRFIRIGIQENAPKILGYRDHIDSDKTFILNHFNGIASKNLKMHIGDYIKQSKVFSESEKQSLNL